MCVYVCTVYYRAVSIRSWFLSCKIACVAKSEGGVFFFNHHLVLSYFNIHAGICLFGRGYENTGKTVSICSSYFFRKGRLNDAI